MIPTTDVTNAILLSDQYTFEKLIVMNKIEKIIGQVWDVCRRD